LQCNNKEEESRPTDSPPKSVWSIIAHLDEILIIQAADTDIKERIEILQNPIKERTEREKNDAREFHPIKGVLHHAWGEKKRFVVDWLHLKWYRVYGRV
jgi:hypothetical protein